MLLLPMSRVEFNVPNSSPMETYVNLLPSPPLLSPPCSEGHDRTELTLPGKQLDLLQTISGAISTPLIVLPSPS